MRTSPPTAAVWNVHIVWGRAGGAGAENRFQPLWRMQLIGLLSNLRKYITNLFPARSLVISLQLQQYASKYAFGYRIRDFHTGNDFGHKQNRGGGSMGDSGTGLVYCCKFHYDTIYNRMHNKPSRASDRQPRVPTPHPNHHQPLQLPKSAKTQFCFCNPLRRLTHWEYPWTKVLNKTIILSK